MTLSNSGSSVHQVLNDVWDKVNGVLKTSATFSGSAGGPNSKNGSDTFTATGFGVTLNASLTPVKSFSLQVKKLGAVSSWVIVLEGSNDGTNFQTILTHDSSQSSDGSMIFTGSLDSPCLFFRSNCTSLSLGGGTNVVATILGLS